MKDYITPVVFRYVLLFVVMYGMYIIMHGHLSPGGGFAGGMVLGLGLLLHFLVFGMEQKERLRRLTMDVTLVMIGIGALMEGVKFILPHEHGPVGAPGELFSVGIIAVVSFGVGLLVASTILSVFHLLVGEE